MAEASPIDLTLDELRAVTGYAVACAGPALEVFERSRAADRRPHQAIEAARGFASGGPRVRAIRDGAWAAMRAAGDAGEAGYDAARQAALAAVAAAGAAFLHPLPNPTQVKHILGSAAHAAHALELEAGDEPAVGLRHIEAARRLASPVVVDVLRRYPTPPAGGGRVGELIRILDAALR